jgi:hypothetical protein
VADLGWHVQINIEAGPILEMEDLWNRLPATLVIDHMGHIRQPQGSKTRRSSTSFVWTRAAPG